MKKTSKVTRKYSEDEIKAAGYFLGLGNLACWTESELLDITQKHKDNFRIMAAVFNSKLGQISETDTMFDGMLAEVESWIKRFKNKDSFCLEVWEGALQHKTMRDVYPRLKSK
jgi:hypothetical protein